MCVYVIDTSQLTSTKPSSIFFWWRFENSNKRKTQNGTHIYIHISNIMYVKRDIIYINVYVKYELWCVQLLELVGHVAVNLISKHIILCGIQIPFFWSYFDLLQNLAICKYEYFCLARILLYVSAENLPKKIYNNEPTRDIQTKWTNKHSNQIHNQKTVDKNIQNETNNIFFVEREKIGGIAL